MNQVVSISNMDRYRLLEIYDPQVGMKTIHSQLHVAKYPRFVLSWACVLLPKWSSTSALIIHRCSAAQDKIPVNKLITIELLFCVHGTTKKYWTTIDLNTALQSCIRSLRRSALNSASLSISKKNSGVGSMSFPLPQCIQLGITQPFALAKD